MATNKTLKFVTGNANKLKEIRLFLGEHFNVDAVPLEVIIGIHIKSNNQKLLVV